MEQDAEIIDFPRRQTEQIAGVAMDLGRMTLLELQVLELQCSERFQEAHTDLTIVRDTISRRFPDGRVS